jgi:hypothetical protein
MYRKEQERKNLNRTTFSLGGNVATEDVKVSTSTREMQLYKFQDQLDEAEIFFCLFVL